MHIEKNVYYNIIDTLLNIYPVRLRTRSKLD